MKLQPQKFPIKRVFNPKFMGVVIFSMIIFIGISIFALNSFKPDKDIASLNGLPLERIKLKFAFPKTNLDKRSIELSEIKNGGVPKDAIAPIDKPVFGKYEDVEKELQDHSPIIVVRLNEKTRGYPLKVLLWHEIVNDTIEDTAIAITYCPLCSAPICFNRRINNEVLTFGTTGLLRNSDLIMYDRKTESFWQQFTGQAIVGNYTGKSLDVLPSSIMSYSEMKSLYPDALIMSQITGFSRRYGSTPYPGYDDRNKKPRLFAGKPDSRLPPMTRVVGIKVGDLKKAYKLSMFEETSILMDTIGEHRVIILKTGSTYSDLDNRLINASKTIPTIKAFRATVDGKPLNFKEEEEQLIDLETKSLWNSNGLCITGSLMGKQLKEITTMRTFAFAWFAFYPESTTYIRNWKHF